MHNLLKYMGHKIGSLIWPNCFWKTHKSKNKIGRALIIVLALIFPSGMVSSGCTHYCQQTKVALFSVRKGHYTVNNNLTERNFRNGYWSKRSYTNVLIRFSHNFADATSSTVLDYVSSYVQPVEMGQYHVGGFLNSQVFIIFESSAKLITSFRYSSGTTIWHITFHSSYTVASDGSPFVHQCLVFHEIVNSKYEPSLPALLRMWALPSAH